MDKEKDNAPAQPQYKISDREDGIKLPLNPKLIGEPLKAVIGEQERIEKENRKKVEEEFLAQLHNPRIPDPKE